MKQKFSRLLGLLFLCAVVASIGFWAFRPQGPVGEKVVLADGTELTLYAITYGKTNDMTYGRPWERLLAYVPDRLATNWNWVTRWRAGVQKVHLAYPEDRLVLWFVGVFPTNSAMAPMPAKPAAATVGGGGFGGGGFGGSGARGGGGGFGGRMGGRFQPEVPWRIAGPEGSESGGVITPVSPTLGARLVPVAVESYPRRLADITFRIYGPVASNVVPGSLVLAGEFVLKNPKISHAPFWTPGALPIRAEEAGVTCVLAKLEVLPPEANSSFPPGMPAGMALRLASLGLLDRVRVVFELFENGEPTPGWTVQQLNILDPTGNQLTGGSGGNTSFRWFLSSSSSFNSWSSGSSLDSTSRSFSGGVSSKTQVRTMDGSTTFLTTQTEDGHQITSFINPLWLDEPAWKIRVVMVRTDDAADTRTFEFLARPEWVRGTPPNPTPPPP